VRETGTRVGINAALLVRSVAPRRVGRQFPPRVPRRRRAAARILWERPTRRCWLAFPRRARRLARRRQTVTAASASDPRGFFFFLDIVDASQVRWELGVMVASTCQDSVHQAARAFIGYVTSYIAGCVVATAEAVSIAEAAGRGPASSEGRRGGRSQDGDGLRSRGGKVSERNERSGLRNGSDRQRLDQPRLERRSRMMTSVSVSVDVAGQPSDCVARWRGSSGWMARVAL